MIRKLLTVIAATTLIWLASPTDASADNSPPPRSADKGQKKQAPSKGTAKKGKATPKKGTAKKGKATPKKGKAKKGKAKKGKAKKGKASKGKASSAPVKTKTLVYGEGDDIEGGVQLPTGDDAAAKGDAGHSSLIRTRAHFIPEILKQAEKI